MTASEDAQEDGQPVVNDKTRLTDLVRDYMEIEWEGERYDRIDEPDRDLYFSMVRVWVLNTTVRRYHFLCQLDSIFQKYEIARQGKEETEEDRQKQNIGYRTARSCSCSGRSQTKGKEPQESPSKKGGETEEEGAGDLRGR